MSVIWEFTPEQPIRKLDEACHFCRSVSCVLWKSPKNALHPFQVRCDSCGARGPECSMAEESAVDFWLSVERKKIPPSPDEG